MKMIKTLWEEINIRSKGFKVLFKVLVCTTIIFFLGLAIIYIPRNYQISKVDDIIINEIKSLEKINNDKMKHKGEMKKVLNFDLQKDTLPFANFGAIVSPGGNCEGYNVFEMLYFEGKLDDFLGLNKKTTYEGKLGNYQFDIGDMKLIYKEGMYYYDYTKSEGGIERDYKKIVKDSYNGDSNKSEKMKEDFTSMDFKKKETKNILEDILYIHENKGYITYRTLPYNSLTPGEKIKGISEKYDSGDVGMIIDSIDNNKLLPIGILNNLGGHSFLAYAYEYLDDNNIKVYVKDSNIPIIHKDNLTDDEIRINREIEGNCYILFTRDLLKDDWSYIYQPVINEVELYGKYNSFIPGTKLSFIRF